MINDFHEIEKQDSRSKSNRIKTKILFFQKIYHPKNNFFRPKKRFEIQFLNWHNIIFNFESPLPTNNNKNDLQKTNERTTYPAETLPLWPQKASESGRNGHPHRMNAENAWKEVCWGPVGCCGQAEFRSQLFSFFFASGSCFAFFSFFDFAKRPAQFFGHFFHFELFYFCDSSNGREEKQQYSRFIRHYWLSMIYNG